MKMEVLFPFIIGKVLTVFADPANKTADLVMFPFLIGKVLTKIVGIITIQNYKS